jgi:tRNA pseudouridine55 synthase
VVCSKGTYIRALARDIGEALDSGAHLTALERTRIGDITLEMCMDPEDIDSFLDSIQIETKENI